MDEISNLSAFIRVVEKGSFTSAALVLNCSTSSISKRVNQLERAVGAKLLNRSTHGVTTLTQEGSAYFDCARTIIEKLEAARECVRDVTDSLQGTLKVHLTPGTGLRIALPAILKFIRSYPALRLDIAVRPENFNILQQGFDVSIHSGGKHDEELSYATVEARELVEARYVICASRAYFEQRGKPSEPRELEKHNCLVSLRHPTPHKWWFRADRRKFAVNVQGNLVADNWTTVHEAANAGLGIARMLCVDAQAELGGVLEPIFSDLVVSDRSVWALTPRLRPMPRKISFFLDFLRRELRSGGSSPAALGG